MSAALALEPKISEAGNSCPSVPPLKAFVPADDVLVNVRWLTRLDLAQPRQGLGCLHRSTRRMKRAIDVLGAVVLLVLASPLMLLAAVLVKLTSRGPVIYSQERVGLNERRNKDRRSSTSIADWEGATKTKERRAPANRRGAHGYGRPFTLYKFRTMTVDAERNGAQFAQKRDPRVTWVGKIMRKTRIDELPQLWNVLKGEMSLVGPRPERPQFVAELNRQIPEFVNRLGLKPGLTGLAQVVNGYDNEVEGFRRKVAYDLAYLQNCCVRNDLKILLRTVLVVLTGQGAL